MKKLIATHSKKNIEKVRKRLEGATLTLQTPGVKSGVVSCAEALLTGHRLLSESKPDQALAIAESLLNKIDDVVDIYILKARALLELEALYELRLLVEPLVRAAPNNRGVLMVAARFFYLLGDAKQSLEYAKKAMANTADNVEMLLQMELCYRYRGEISKAERILEHCLEKTFIAPSKNQPNGKELNEPQTAALFRLANYAPLSDERLFDLETICKNAKDPAVAVQSFFAMAAQCKKRRNKAGEVKYLQKANASAVQLMGLDSRIEKIEVSYQKKYAIQNDFFSNVKLNPSASHEPIKAPVSEYEPIFILGLPRSGTTLLEQILGGHSAVGQVGESKAFLHALRRACLASNPMWKPADYPYGLDKLSNKTLDELVVHFESHQAVLSDKALYIDKELSNFEYVGSMAALLPKAKFIHMDRAPMDIFLSCFRNNIPGVPETANLTALAHYYLYMKRLIGLWRRLFADRLMIINYQALVNEPEKVVREATKFLGIQFEQGMLDFHERKNIVRTLSVDQVRKKVYTSSVGGWREYSEMLAPAYEVLEKHNIPIDEGVAYL